MRKKISILFMILAVLATAFIFMQSADTAAESSKKSGRIVELLMRLLPFEIPRLTVLIRKAAHMAEFFVQAVCIGLSLVFGGRFVKNIIYILFTGLFTACTDEFIQNFSLGRGSLVSDVFIDFAGCVIGVLFCMSIYCLDMLINYKKR